MAAVSLQVLNARALGGDVGAATELAGRSMQLETFAAFFDEFVPKDEHVAAFSTFWDAWQAARVRPLLDTAAVPAIESGVQR